jgi:hypothetical protein
MSLASSRKGMDYQRNKEAHGVTLPVNKLKILTEQLCAQTFQQEPV